MKIGIGVTTHNRYEVFKKTLAEIKNYAPKGAKIVVVDDASDIAVPEATYRFNKNVGIARAKNKCFELLDDCNHIFLFDDDCYPITEAWWKPYVESKEPHLCYIFTAYTNGRSVGDSVLLYDDGQIAAYSHPRGCMLYFDHKCLETVGGMDETYGKWGYEHVDLSNRIFNTGLTTFRYMDVTHSDNLIYSHDEHNTVDSTTPVSQRIDDIINLKPHFLESFESTEFHPYNVKKEICKVSNGLILTTYITGLQDTQRDKVWEFNYNDLIPLLESVGNQQLIVLNNNMSVGVINAEGNIRSIQIQPTINPYFQRWISQYQFLRDNPQYDYIWLVDSTDVEMLKDPFENLVKGKLYVGYEPKYLANDWMLNNFKQNCYSPMFRTYGSKTLLNCGVVGGSREDIMALIHDMLGFYSDHAGNVGQFEMGMFNYVVLDKWQNRVIYGPTVTTIFKGYEQNNKIAIWRHK